MPKLNEDDIQNLILSKVHHQVLAAVVKVEIIRIHLSKITF
jgi:hypothetical protein